VRTVINRRRGVLREEGASIVEMAFVCFFLILPMFFGIFALSAALYAYHYISEAAREGSRYAMVRGSTSCANTPNLTNCNATSAQVQTYVQNLGYPGINGTSNMTVNTTWYSATGSPPTSWATTACGITAACRAPGNLVKVNVVYNFPLSIPFYGTRTLSMSSNSQMVVSQ
jgi:Flp pilus assembly protein TadG